MQMLFSYVVKLCPLFYVQTKSQALSQFCICVTYMSIALLNVNLTSHITLFFTWPMPLHAPSSPVTLPPFAVLNLMPKSPSGPPGLWLAVRMMPLIALYFLITQEMAGVDIIP